MSGAFQSWVAPLLVKSIKRIAIRCEGCFFTEHSLTRQGISILIQAETDTIFMQDNSSMFLNRSAERFAQVLFPIFTHFTIL